ncbi:hypothetical protein PsYK624_140820 [Phanerochaete sordida]|uniref:Uncharacterized protein n=1 Tax=Phanerochaete sordida TaxID=48140 RepID=A0A9P3GQV8_9APHY|nr:hypothetical protein PsYK624_140820 [Phanerochaete sordida]
MEPKTSCAAHSSHAVLADAAAMPRCQAQHRDRHDSWSRPRPPGYHRRLVRCASPTLATRSVDLLKVACTPNSTSTLAFNAVVDILHCPSVQRDPPIHTTPDSTRTLPRNPVVDVLVHPNVQPRCPRTTGRGHSGRAGSRRALYGAELLSLH